MYILSMASGGPLGADFGILVHRPENAKYVGKYVPVTFPYVLD
jgi:hypothetical protein